MLIIWVHVPLTCIKKTPRAAREYDRTTQKQKKGESRHEPSMCMASQVNKNDETNNIKDRGASDILFLVLSAQRVKVRDGNAMQDIMHKGNGNKEAVYTSSFYAA